MRLVEKVLLGVFLFLLLLLALGIESAHSYLTLVSFALAIIYVFASHWIFNTTDKSFSFLRLISGVCLAAGILSIHYNILLRQEDFFDIYLPITSLIGTLYLSIKVVINRLKEIQVAGYKINILSRLIPIALFSSFLAFGNPKTAVYRAVVISLNPDNEELISNMRMFEYSNKADKFKKIGDCTTALEYSLKAFDECMNWLSPKAMSFYDIPKHEIWKFNYIYTLVFKSYDCLSEQARDNGDYELSLAYQHMADSVININPVEKKLDTHIERANSKNDLAVCFEHLENYDSAFHYYSEAIRYYSDSIQKKDKRLAILFTNFGMALKRSENSRESNLLLKAALKTYENDSTILEASRQMAYLYLQIARNDLNLRDIYSAKINLSNYADIGTEENYCLFEIYSAIAHLHSDEYDSAENRARLALNCYNSKYKKNIEPNANCNIVLYEAKLAKAEYDSAEIFLQEALKISRNILPANSFKFAEYYSREGNLYYSLGKYSLAQSKFEQCERIYNNNLESSDPEYIEIYTSLALINSILGHHKNSVFYLKKAMKLSFMSDIFSDKSFTYLMNELAYTNYYVGNISMADSIYNVAYVLNEDERQDTQMANIINGLGLVAINRKKYKASDSLFIRSEALYKTYLKNDHPAIGTVQMNKGELHLLQKSYESSLELLHKALASFNKYYGDSHPDSGRAHLLLAQAYFQSDQTKLSESHANKALEILSENFDQNHQLVIMTKKILALNS